MDIIENTYAKKKSGEVLHVSKAPSGRRGYFCLGCDQQMQAVHFSDPKRKSYFRHDPKFVTPDNACTYRDETYRHKLAKDILQRLKWIKVPVVKKFAPKGTEGDPMILKDSETIEGHSVLIERQFYESDDGQVFYGSNPDIKFKHEIIRPDVAFLDQENRPILFIEIVATHKVSQEKILKIRRLGINTVQVKIPRDSPEEIERSFRILEHTKWLFHETEFRTTYVQPSRSHTERVSSAATIERPIFEESYACRAAQIGNLVRSIRRCYSGEQYAEIESRIQRTIEEETRELEKLERRREEFRNTVRERVHKKHEHEETEQSEFQEGISRRYNELEGRYNRKRRELESEQEAVYRDIDAELGTKKWIEERRKEIARDFRGAEINLERLRRSIEDEFGNRTSIPARFRRQEEELEEKFRIEESRIERDKEEAQLQGQQLHQRIKSLREELESKFIALREELNSAVRDRNLEGAKGKFRTLHALLQKRKRVTSIENLKTSLDRTREAYECFKSGTWKSWPK